MRLNTFRLPAYDDEDTVQSTGNTDNLNLRLNLDPNAADILNMPAPAALHHFHLFCP